MLRIQSVTDCIEKNYLIILYTAENLIVPMINVDQVYKGILLVGIHLNNFLIVHSILGQTREMLQHSPLSTSGSVALGVDEMIGSGPHIANSGRILHNRLSGLTSYCTTIQLSSVRQI